MSDTVGEKATLLDYLSHYREVIERKCEDLDAGQLATRSVPPSSLSLLGLVRHLAKVERDWFPRTLAERPETPRLYWTEEDPELAFTGAVADDAVVTEAFATWRQEVAAADAWLAELPEADLGREVPHRDGPVSVRDVLVHLIEEYARHAGHADLLRECLDGRTGE
ncbi:DinB family protein [Kineococcus sp. R86509]|uniref:DinB family protein n=1 Tax=Kineococcus sp. R86509 TaxID=3093851 RepID=UPI0036D2CC4B